MGNIFADPTHHSFTMNSLEALRSARHSQFWWNLSCQTCENEYSRREPNETSMPTHHRLLVGGACDLPGSSSQQPKQSSGFLYVDLGVESVARKPGTNFTTNSGRPLAPADRKMEDRFGYETPDRK